jgi:hypothetical protein
MNHDLVAEGVVRLTVAARELGKSPATLIRAALRHDLEAIRFGGRGPFYTSRAALSRWAKRPRPIAPNSEAAQPATADRRRRMRSKLDALGLGS